MLVSLRKFRLNRRSRDLRFVVVKPPRLIALAVTWGQAGSWEGVDRHLRHDLSSEVGIQQGSEPSVEPHQNGETGIVRRHGRQRGAARGRYKQLSRDLGSGFCCCAADEAGQKHGPVSVKLPPRRPFRFGPRQVMVSCCVQF